VPASEPVRAHGFEPSDRTFDSGAGQSATACNNLRVHGIPGVLSARPQGLLKIAAASERNSKSIRACQYVHRTFRCSAPTVRAPPEPQLWCCCRPRVVCRNYVMKHCLRTRGNPSLRTRQSHPTLVQIYVCRLYRLARVPVSQRLGNSINICVLCLGSVPGTCVCSVGHTSTVNRAAQHHVQCPTPRSRHHILSRLPIISSALTCAGCRGRFAAHPSLAPPTLRCEQPTRGDTQLRHLIGRKRKHALSPRAEIQAELFWRPGGGRRRSAGGAAATIR
jgi:hypothetical protein